MAEAETAQTIQGKSFAHLLEKPQQEFRNYAFAGHNWHDYEVYERAVITKKYLYPINRRTNLDNGGPIDANQSPSAKALKEAYKAGKLNNFQKDIFANPRLTEEFYDSAKELLQSKNEFTNPAYRNEIADLKSVFAKWQTETADTKPAHLTPDWYDRKTGEPLPTKDKRGEMPGASLHADQVNRRGPF